MAEKVKESTLIIEVNLACERSHKKIQKVLCKLQVKENIRSIAFDSKKNTVTITGPFDPDKLSQKLKCKAGCVIKSIKPPPPPPPPPPVIKNEPVATASASASATVNLGFTQVCVLCHPRPCSDPISHCSQSKQIRHCEGMPVPAVVPSSTCSRPPCCRGGCGNSCCPGPSACRGCMGCRGGCGNSCGTGGGAHGCPATPARPWCPGPPACRGCMGCRVVHEEKFRYESYPPTSCAIM